MKRWLSLILLLIVFAGIVSAQTEIGIIKRVAENFISEKLSEKNMTTPHDFRLSQPVPIYNGNLFLVTISSGGYVIISGSENAIPVLAYSLDESFPDSESLPCNVNYWLNRYSEQISFLKTNEFSNNKAVLLWSKYAAEDFRIRSDNNMASSVEPLIISKWNQPWPYNGMCPADAQGSHGHCVTGCVATAMGQLLYYYRFPEHGLGSYAYYHPDYDSIAANFDTTYYRWNEMLSSVNQQNDAIAELLFHQGASVDMDYGPSSSGMWNHKAAYSLQNHFRMGPETVYYFRDSITLDWDSILIANLDQRKPLYYAGWAGVGSESGHAFVCDGYDNPDYFHFNWGWGGSYDGYFYLNTLTPGGSNFNYAQEVIPMFPDTINNVYPHYCAGSDTLTLMKGSIEDGSGWYDYQNNSICDWLITPHDDNLDSIASLKITFHKLKTASGTDFVNIYDGNSTSAPLIGSFSGTTVPAVINTTGNQAFITFNSDSDNSNDGWILDYEAILPIYCTGQKTITNISGEISDGSNEYNYQNKASCRWKITPPDTDSIKIEFTEFATADSNDYVSVIDMANAQLLGKYYGSQVPPVIKGSGKIMIIFMTNETTSAPGWKLNYNKIETVQHLSETGGNFICYPNPATDMIHIELFYSRNSDALICLYDMTGKKLLEQNTVLKQGQNKIPLILPERSTMAHYLVIRTNEQIFKKIIIVK